MPDLRECDIHYNPQNIIDPTVDFIKFAELIKYKTPFSYLRYGDGEFRAILEYPGKNCDEHEYFTRMGKRLFDELVYIKTSSMIEKINIYVGLHGTWHQKEIQTLLFENNMVNTIHWVSMLITRFALEDLTLIPFLEEIKKTETPLVFIGNESHNVIAEALLCSSFIEIPYINAYLEIDNVINICKNLPGFFDIQMIFIACAGMPTEILLGTLRRLNNNHVYIDCGAVFDSIVGRKTRGYMRTDKNDELIKNVYLPLFNL